MYKKSRITSLKHRATRLKRVEQRKLARRLIKGDLNLDQLDRLVGDGAKGVLKTVNYLNEVVGLSLPPTLASAVTQVMAPATSGAVASKLSGRSVPGATARRPRAVSPTRAPNKISEDVAETTLVEAEAPKRPRARRAKAEPEAAATAAVVETEAPKRPRARRAKSDSPQSG